MMTKKELKKISLQYRTLSSQMLKIDTEDEKVHIQAFYEFISKTPFIHNYIEECHQQNYDLETVFSHLGYHESVLLPSDQIELIDFGYQLISCILESKRRLSSYGQHYTTSRKYADMIIALMRKVIEPFVVALRSYLEICMIDMDDVEKTEINTNTVTVFLSYCQKDSGIADQIDEGLQDKLKDAIHISRDIRDVAYHESFKQFMQSIQDHDFVIILISDRYMKSRNCMFEMLETVKDVKYQHRLLFIVLKDEDKKYLSDSEKESIEADVYSVDGETKYIMYWKHRNEELQNQIQQIGDPMMAINQVKERKIVQRILLDLPDFLEFIRDNKGVPLEEHISENYARICKYMKLNV